MATRRFVTARAALALAVSIGLLSGPPSTAAQDAPATAVDEAGHGSLHGTLYQPDEKGPLAGAKVTAINTRTGKQYTSNVTTVNGGYAVDRLPEGTYDVVIEMGGILFVTERVIDIGPGESVSKSYSVQPQRPANREIPNLPKPKGSAALVGEAEVKRPFWTSTGGKVLIGVLGAGAAAAVAGGSSGGGSSNNASPSSP
jgi:hypothetical protein